MARCRCGIDQCACQMAPGSYTTVRGDGSTGAPFQVDVQPTVDGAIIFQDTTTIDFQTSGFGSQASPLLVTAEARIGAGVIELVAGDLDIAIVTTGAGTVADPLTFTLELPSIDTGGVGGTPGDVLIRDASGVFVSGPVSVSSGAVYVQPGLMGDGSIGNPLGLDLCTYGDIKTPRLCARAVAMNGQSYPAVTGVDGENLPSAGALGPAGFVASPVGAWATGNHLTVDGFRFHWSGTTWQPGVAP